MALIIRGPLAGSRDRTMAYNLVQAIRDVERGLA